MVIEYNLVHDNEYNLVRDNEIIHSNTLNLNIKDDILNALKKHKPKYHDKNS